jgi:hypothetical protein
MNIRCFVCGTAINAIKTILMASFRMLRPLLDAHMPSLLIVFFRLFHAYVVIMQHV